MPSGHRLKRDWSVVVSAPPPSDRVSTPFPYRQLQAVLSAAPSRVAHHETQAPHVAPSGLGIFHVLMPLVKVPIDHLWPRWARSAGVALAVTLTDEDCATTSVGGVALALREELVRAADVVFIESEVGARRAVDRFGLSADRVVPLDGELAQRSLDGYQQAVDRMRHGLGGAVSRRRGTDRLALVGPMPPDDTGIAIYNWRLACALAKYLRVELYGDRTLRSSYPPESKFAQRPVAALPWIVGSSSDHRPPLYVIANSPHHVRAWLALTQWGGDVFLHDVYLSGLYGSLVLARLLPYATLEEAIWNLEGERLPPGMRRRKPRRLPMAKQLALGVTFVGDLVDRSRRVLVHSETAREMILLARPHREPDIRVVPYGIPPPFPPGPRRDGPPLVVSFGSVKHGRLFVEMAARVARVRPDVRFALAGPAPGVEAAARLSALIAQHGLEERFDLLEELARCEWISTPEYERLRATATVAVQLREHFYGETSGSTRADCLPAGIPTVTNRAGTQVELPESVVVHVSAAPSPKEVAAAVVELLDDEGRRQQLREAALRYVAANGFEATAAAVIDAIS